VLIGKRTGIKPAFVKDMARQARMNMNRGHWIREKSNENYNFLFSMGVSPHDNVLNFRMNYGKEANSVKGLPGWPNYFKNKGIITFVLFPLY
jgi:hypothetical protein